MVVATRRKGLRRGERRVGGGCAGPHGARCSCQAPHQLQAARRHTSRPAAHRLLFALAWIEVAT
eukprot:3231746-Rhodomonas_salina.1